MAECPKSFECESPDVSLDVGRVPSYISIVSSAFSCLGSLLIIVAYAVVKDRRRGVQTMVAQLAVADFILASGFIMGAVNFLLSYNRNDVEDACKNFQAVCKVQSLITTWTSITSYIILDISDCALLFYSLCVQPGSCICQIDTDVGSDSLGFPSPNTAPITLPRKTRLFTVCNIKLVLCCR